MFYKPVAGLGLENAVGVLQQVVSLVPGEISQIAPLTQSYHLLMCTLDQQADQFHPGDKHFLAL